MKESIGAAFSKGITILANKYVLFAGLALAAYGLFGSHYWLESGLFLGCVQSACHELIIFLRQRQ